MQVVVERLIEILVAMLLAGVLLLAFNGFTTNQWPISMVFIVPVGFMWSFALGATAAADFSRGLFLLTVAVVVLGVYIVARYLKGRVLRISLETAIFIAMQATLVYLFSAQGLLTA